MGTCKKDAFPSSTSFGNIPGKLLCYTLGGIREKGKSNKGLGGMELNVWDAIRSTPGASPPHLGGRARRDEYGTCIAKGQTKSDQERKASV